jgi:hypothetical protein
VPSASAQSLIVITRRVLIRHEAQQAHLVSY